MHRRLVACALLMFAGFTARAGELQDCRALHPSDAAGRPVVGIEDLAFDEARDRLILSAYDRRAVDRALRAEEAVPEGGLYALPLDRLDGGEVRLAPLGIDRLPAGGLRPHGIGLEGDRLAVVNRTVADGRLRPVVDVFGLGARGPAHRRRLTHPLLCRPNDVAWTRDRRLIVTNDRGACAGARLWWERVLNRPASFVMAFGPEGAGEDAGGQDGGGRVVATGFRFANGIATTPRTAWIAATRGRALHRLGRADTVALPFAPDNLSVDAEGAVWAAGPASLWRYAAFRAGWLASPGASGIARLEPDGELATFTVGAVQLRGATVALAVDDRLVLGAAYDDRLLVCRRPP